MKKSIKQTLEDIIRDNDFLEDGLYHGYVNLTSLASYMLPIIQKISGKETTVGSVTMTLSRIAQGIQKTTTRVRVRPEDIRIRMGISYINFTKARGLTTTLNNISNQTSDIQEKTAGQLFTQLEWGREITVLYTKFFADVMEGICAQFPPQIILHDLTALVIYIPAEYLEKKGFVYYIVKQLNYFWVNIVELYSTQTEFTILVQKEDIKIAVNLLG